MIDTAERRADLKQQFIAKRGYWNESWEFILEHNPDFFEGYLHLSSYAWEHRSLDPKTKELIYIATVASVTHLFKPGLRQHTRNALRLGATEEELLAVLNLISTIGVQTFLLGVCTLEQVRPGTAGSVRPALGGPDALLSLRDRHRELFGEVLPEADLGMRADPGFYARFLDLAAVSLGDRSVLAAKEAHLIALAAYASVTQLSGPGVRQHIEAALRHGATAAEIIEVCEQIAGMSIHSVTVGLPILQEELAAWRLEQSNVNVAPEPTHSVGNGELIHES